MGRTRRWCRCAWPLWRHTGGTDPAIGFTIIRSVLKTRTSGIYPMRTSCAQVAGTLASDVFKQTEQGYLDGPGFGCTSPARANSRSSGS